MSPAAPAKIEVIARAVAVANSRILLCRNVKHGHAYLPGGHVEPGETASEALAREFAEETGLRISVREFLLANEGLFTQKGKARHELNLVFHVEHGKGPWPEDVPTLEKKLAFEWVDPAALPEAGLVPPAILAWLLSGGPAQAPGRRDRWLSHTEAAAR